jgi:NAD(P)-dependent dehydrogenase (short-subunit alcohol dehydrogenase family)
MLMAAYNVLITGASRGLGLEFTKQYAADGWNVLACCRAPQQASALQGIANANKNVQIFDLDVSDFAQIDALALQLKDEKIDVLINNAGVYPPSSFGDTNYDEWAKAFKVNSMAPLKMAEAFVQHVTRGQLKKIAVLTSKMGSIDDNTSGESYSYRASKTAVNMVMKSLSIDLKPYGISVVTLHPGWVQTDMGGRNALISAQTSVSGLRNVIEHLNIENTGRFIAFDGKAINW